MRFLASIGLATCAFFLTGCLAEQAPKDTSKLKKLGIEDVKVGDGLVAEKGDLVYMLYEGHLEDGTIFDGNMDPGKNVLYFIMDTGGVIKGWDQGILGMKEGGERKLEIPPSLGYGPVGSPPKIPPYADLYFTVKLLYVLKKDEEHAYVKEDTKVGSGPEVKEGDTVEVHYVGKYLNDKEFDNSRTRGSTVKFKVGAKEAIPGLDTGIRGMKPGGERTLILPPSLSFGMAGNESVQGGQVVVFDVSLISVNGKKS